MGQQASAISKEAIWRDHLTRYAASGKTIAAFCRDEAIAEGNFYAWRTRLRQDTANMAEEASTSAPKCIFASTLPPFRVSNLPPLRVRKLPPIRISKLPRCEGPQYAMNRPLTTHRIRMPLVGNTL